MFAADYVGKSGDFDVKVTQLLIATPGGSKPSGLYGLEVFFKGESIGVFPPYSNRIPPAQWIYRDRLQAENVASSQRQFLQILKERGQDTSVVFHEGSLDTASSPFVALPTK